MRFKSCVIDSVLQKLSSNVFALCAETRFNFTMTGFFEAESVHCVLLCSTEMKRSQVKGKFIGALEIILQSFLKRQQRKLNFKMSS